MSYYVSLQYSAIQKTVLRHDHLWSIAGISHGLAQLNEVTLRRIIEKDCKGTVLVAGGGKCTAVFDDSDKETDDKAEKRAEDARRAIEKEIATTFPMLEFHLAAQPAEAANFQAAWNNELRKDINDQKVRHTLWKHLQQIYPPDLWESLKIVDDAGKHKTGDHLPQTDLDELVRKIAEAYPLPFDENGL